MSIFNLAISTGCHRGSAEDFFKAGDAKRAKGDMEGAIADYCRAIELDPRAAAAYCNRGIAKKAKDDSEGAIADYNRAIELDPKDATAYYNRGIAKKGSSGISG